MKYFKTIPTLRYETFDGSGQSKVVTNIFTKVRATLEAKTDRAVFYTYDVEDGQTPEIIAWKYYGSTDYLWIILLFNDIIDPKWDWVLTQPELRSFIANKYGSVAEAKDQTRDPHHYETLELLAPSDGYGFKEGNVVQEAGLIVEDDFTFSYGTGISPYDWVSTLDVYNSAIKAVYDYEYEDAENEKKRQIRLLRREYIPQIVEEFEELVQSKVR